MNDTRQSISKALKLFAVEVVYDRRTNQRNYPWISFAVIAEGPQEAAEVLLKQRAYAYQNARCWSATEIEGGTVMTGSDSYDKKAILKVAHRSTVVPEAWRVAAAKELAS